MIKRLRRYALLALVTAPAVAVGCVGAADGGDAPGRGVEFRPSDSPDAQVCCAAPQDICGYRGDGLCDIGCAWGLDPDCTTGQNACGDGICQLSIQETCENCAADCCKGDQGGLPGGFGGGPNGGGTGNTGGFGNTGNTGGSGNTGNTGGFGNTGNTGGFGNTGGTAGTGSAQCVPPAGIGTCDTAPQCGCGPGQQCGVVDLNSGATGCIPSGPVPPYHQCGQDSDCQPGHGCVSGACAKFCESPTECGGSPCVAVGNSGRDIPGYRVCGRNCHPAIPGQPPPGFEPCGPNLHCFQLSSGQGSLCAGPASPFGTIGAPCYDQNFNVDHAQCAPGHACLNFGTPQCALLCTVGQVGCPLPFSCIPFEPTSLVGGAPLGVCN